MKKNVRLVATVAASLLVASASADWNPGDSYKMHFPQLPDPLGWDVAVQTFNAPPPAAVADDWLCTESGPVTDIHIWFSMRGDQPPNPALMAFSIWSDVPDPDGPSGPAYSMPGTMLWSRLFGPTAYTIRQYGTGQQGWYDPNNQLVILNDHINIWQLNVRIQNQPFEQQAGQIYWLGVNFQPTWNGAGWKTSLDHFNDDAVWWDFSQNKWMELRDPRNSQSLDMAFVITTPEPGSAGLLGLGGALLALVWRRADRR